MNLVGRNPTAPLVENASSRQRPSVSVWASVMALLCVAFLILTLAVIYGTLRPLDLAVSSAFQRIWWPPVWSLFEAIAVIGGVEVTGVAAASVFVYLVLIRRWREATAFLTLPMAFAAEAITKLVVIHPQPPVTHAGRLSVTTFVQGQVNSYPSGHAVRSIIVYGLIAVLITRFWRGERIRRGAPALAAVLIAAVGFDRLYLGVHWASDVMGGFLLGGAFFVLGILWMRHPRAPKSETGFPHSTVG